ncbi:hypothetical protein W1080910_176 [Cyanophage S-RIM12 isolate W1_08_0910]|uniref:DUF7201 domain-containing protein n=3 Tax=Brizovirus TaxID=2733098 RepID=A0A1D7SP33_9CAUD|nr:hypothetical protein HOQ65_gp060 [Cyanophage S-RIM12 isolate RW_06_0310]YP_009779585.1 hypothetical protein HOQ66_gp060 [Cyanophage S-RIM12 isolate W1_08_0910]AOO15448.1 hypothetical protein Np150310_174 [Cyanophage S-RIM12_Np_15_0310]AOO16088.1 hypothetical protein RW040310_174 [Cyanophage S-RIM12_RW_04_0310]AOO18881.1 hypothetical protein W1120610_175 [Cyanophage S-RIM12_W1_12_0610]AOO19308.1 hypothetical protein WH050310_174 [Cyanophage S-RIM12_WH_05_0310]AOO16518.1 hypothetical protein
MDSVSELNTAIIERLERVVDTLQDNSIQMGKLLAVHNEKLDKQDKVDTILFEKLDRLSTDLNRETTAIKKGCERDIRLIDDRLRVLEKKMWSIAGALAVISVLISPLGQRILGNALTPTPADVRLR